MLEQEKWFLCSIETFLYQHSKRLEHFFFFFITTRSWMLAARLTSASSFLVAKDSPVSPTDKIWYIILVGMFLCLLVRFNIRVALSSNHCTSVILEICIFCWHKHICLILVYIFDKYMEALWTGYGIGFIAVYHLY